VVRDAPHAQATLSNVGTVATADSVRLLKNAITDMDAALETAIEIGQPVVAAIAATAASVHAAKKELRREKCVRLCV
jgi:hypothetical protein